MQRLNIIFTTIFFLNPLQVNFHLKMIICPFQRFFLLRIQLNPLGKKNVQKSQKVLTFYAITNLKNQKRVWKILSGHSWKSLQAFFRDTLYICSRFSPNNNPIFCSLTHPYLKFDSFILSEDCFNFEIYSNCSNERWCETVVCISKNNDTIVKIKKRTKNK